LWVGTWVSVGYFAGQHITTVYHYITQYSTYLLIALAVAFVGYVAYRLRKRGKAQRRKAERGEAEQPEHGEAEHGAAEHGEAEQGKPERGRAEHGRAEHGRAEHGEAEREPKSAAGPGRGSEEPAASDEGRSHAQAPREASAVSRASDGK